MSDYGFNVARVTLLERNGRFGDAATIHLEEGRPIEAIRLFMRDVANPHSRDRAAESVLQGLSNEISFGVPVPSPGSEARSQLDRLLSLSRELTTTSVDSLSTKTRDKVIVSSLFKVRDLIVVFSWRCFVRSLRAIPLLFKPLARSLLQHMKIQPPLCFA